MSNQTKTIAELVNLSESGENLFYFGTDGNYTTPALLQMGVVVCYSCGNIGSIDDKNCLKCGDDSFVVQPPKVKKVKIA